MGVRQTGPDARRPSRFQLLSCFETAGGDASETRSKRPNGVVEKEGDRKRASEVLGGGRPIKKQDLEAPKRVSYKRKT